MTFSRICLPILIAFSSCNLLRGEELQPRLHGPIESDSRTVLRGSRAPRVVGARTLGDVPADLPLHGVTLVFRRTAAQEAELQQLLRAQQDPSSAEFHHWLTPESFGERFGVAAKDLTATKAWLTLQGLQVTGVSRAQDRLTFSGTAGQVSAALGTNLRRYQVEGETHLATDSDISLPAALGEMTMAVLHLSDFRPRAMVMAAPRPAFTGSDTQAHYLTPKDLAVLYNVTDTYTGAGHSIAVVGQSYVERTSFDSPVSTFDVNTNNANPYFTILVPGTGVQARPPFDLGESEIDLEYAAGLASTAQLTLVYVGSDPAFSVFDALAYAIDQKVAEVVSISYGECETFLSQSEVEQSNALFEQAGAQGQTLVAASGDVGATACARQPTSSNFTITQQQALAVDFPASSPYVTAVGGTQMAPGTFSAGSSPYWSSSTSLSSAGSLLSYVPETVWNEGSVLIGLAASGGGESVHFQRPAWQSSIKGVASSAGRLIPDVALQASTSSPGFLFCTSDAAILRLQGQTFGCSEGLLGSNNQPTVSGGTSFAAPTFAGMVAQMNVAQGSAGQGNLNPLLYQLAGTSPEIFHDVITGTTACVPGSPRCGAAGQSAFAAGAGYDEATGLGSVNLGSLLAALPPAPSSPLEQTGVLIMPDSDTAEIGGTVSAQIAVGSSYRPGGETIPTGTVTVAVDGVVAERALALKPKDVPHLSDLNSYAAYSFVGPAPAGSHVLTVTYSGDATHASSNNLYPILVGNVLATGGVTLSVANAALLTNGSASSAVMAMPTGGYNGRLNWDLAIVSSTVASGPELCYSIASLPVAGASSTQLFLGAGTTCSSSRAAAGLRPAQVPGRTTATGRTTLAVTCGLALLVLLPGVRRRSFAPLCTLVFVLPLALSLSGCGGGASPTAGVGTGSTANARAVSYTAVLSGTDSVNSQLKTTATFTITVQ